MNILNSCSRSALLVTLELGLASTTAAGPDFPYAEMPDRLPGLETGVLQPRDTIALRIGTRQPTGVNVTNSATGLQNYDGGATYRGQGRLSFGFSIQVFDDVTERFVFGSQNNLTFVGGEVEAKYALAEGPNFYAAVSGSVGVFRFAQEMTPISEDFTAATLSLPMTYRTGSGLELHGGLGYTWLPDDFGGTPGYGARSFVSLGAGYAFNERWYAYASAKALFREQENGPEGPDRDVLYAAGVRYALTPQTTATLYVSSSQGNTPIADDVGYVATNDDVIIGAEFTITPSRKRFNIARYRPGVAPADPVAQFRDGFTMPGAQTIGSNRVRFSPHVTSEESFGVAMAISPDPDIQFDVVVEDFALNGSNTLINEANENYRAMIGLRWQAMSQDEGAPFSLGFNTLFSRDLDTPTIGVLYAGVTAERAVSETVRLRGNIRGAAVRDTDILAIGTGIDWNLGNDYVAMAEYNYVSEGDDIWAIGARRQLRNDAPAAWEIYATNASGRHGIGTMIASDTYVGFGLHWQLPSSLF